MEWNTKGRWLLPTLANNTVEFQQIHQLAWMLEWEKPFLRSTQMQWSIPLSIDSTNSLWPSSQSTCEFESSPLMKSFTDDDDDDNVKWMEMIFWVNGQFFLPINDMCEMWKKVHRRVVTLTRAIKFSSIFNRSGIYEFIWLLYRWFCWYVIFNCYGRSSISSNSRMMKICMCQHIHNCHN